MSRSLGVDAGQQSGYTYVDNNLHASLWTGTAASWVDLNPTGAIESNVGGINNGLQVGMSLIDDVRHASIWSGTAESWVSLNSFLPSQYSSAIAVDTWNDGTNVYVVGGAHDGTNWEAVMWTAPVPEPASMIALGAGLSTLMIRRRRKKL